MCDREDPASQGHVHVFNEGQGCEDSKETKLQKKHWCRRKEQSKKRQTQCIPPLLSPHHFYSILSATHILALGDFNNIH